MTWVNGLLGKYFIFPLGTGENLSFHLQLHIALCAKKSAARLQEGMFKRMRLLIPKSHVRNHDMLGECMFFGE